MDQAAHFMEFRHHRLIGRRPDGQTLLKAVVEFATLANTKADGGGGKPEVGGSRLYLGLEFFNEGAHVY